MRDYVRVPAVKPLPTNTIELINLSDEEYIKHIFYFLLSLYKKIDSSTIWKLIEKNEQGSNRKKDRERIIQRYIYKELDKQSDFLRSGFILNKEPENEGSQIGKYDLKFDHGFWRSTNQREDGLEIIIRKFLILECKCLDTVTRTSHTVKEYVYIKNTQKEDGGVYRFLLDDKYATEQRFGGMLGFVLGGDVNKFIEEIQQALRDLKNKIDFGHLIENGIIKDSIDANKFTFDSIHTRKNGMEIKIHHLLFDFVKK